MIRLIKEVVAYQGIVAFLETDLTCRAIAGFAKEVLLLAPTSVVVTSSVAPSIFRVSTTPVWAAPTSPSVGEVGGVLRVCVRVLVILGGICCEVGDLLKGRVLGI